MVLVVSDRTHLRAHSVRIGFATLARRFRVGSLAGRDKFPLRVPYCNKKPPAVRRRLFALAFQKLVADRGEVGYDTVVGVLKDRGAAVRIDGNDRTRALHTNNMMHGTRDTNGEI